MSLVVPRTEFLCRNAIAATTARLDEIVGSEETPRGRTHRPRGEVERCRGDERRRQRQGHRLEPAGRTHRLVRLALLAEGTLRHRLGRPHAAGAEATGAGRPGPIELTLAAWAEDEPGDKHAEQIELSYPALREWWLREGGDARTPSGEAGERLAEHMPELVPTWRRLTEMVDDEHAGAVLALWNPPAFLGLLAGRRPGQESRAGTQLRLGLPAL